MIGPFTTREVAIAFWLGVIVLSVLLVKKLRPGAVQVIRTALHPKIVLPILLLALYTACITWGLWKIGAWKVSLLKDTVIWFLFSCLGAVFSLVTSKPQQQPFRRIARDQISLLVPIEFVLNTYTFHFAVELVLIPVLTFLAMVQVVSLHKGTAPEVAKLSAALQGTILLTIVAMVTVRLVTDLDTLQWDNTLREVTLPVTLTLLTLPALFLLVLYSKYELCFSWSDRLERWRRELGGELAGD